MVFGMKTFSCTSISAFVQQSHMLDDIDHAVRQGDFTSNAELSFHSGDYSFEQHDDGVRMSFNRHVMFTYT